MPSGARAAPRGGAAPRPVDGHRRGGAVARREGIGGGARLIVTTALDYLGGLAPSVDGREPLALELADLYDRVGDIQGGDESSPDHSVGLGDAAGALRSYRAALALRERADAHAAAADSHERIARALRAAGRLDEAREETRRAAERRNAQRPAEEPRHS